MVKEMKSKASKPRQLGHPYGVQPWGNFYLKQQPEIRTAGLGLMSALSDDLLLSVLYLLPAADLARLGLASKALYCFAHTVDLWKALAIQELPEDFRWCVSWRETYLCHKAPHYHPGSHRPLQVEGFYSDLLHQPWYCASVELQQTWLEVDNIDRRSGLSPEQFRQQYELTNRPVVMTDKITDWPARKKWNRHYLAAALAGRPVIVGNMPWRFGSYLAYCDEGAEQDEMPLYMFDKAFASASPQLAGDYCVPDVFTEDLFEVLGEDNRPDYRWLIVGPARSGSSFHIDPNATCAWNALVSGRKKWILFPPGSTPPGVYPSPDGADVAAPISLIEWLLNFYDEARNSKNPPIETIVEAGEVIYVPRGWWHLALNLEPFTVAVTQNYVSSAGLPAVLKFLKSGKAELVSGCCLADRSSLHDRFMAALQQQRPDVLADLQRKQQKQQKQREAEHRLSLLFKQVPVVHQQQQQQQETSADEADASGEKQAAAAAAAPGGFSFGFGFSSDKNATVDHHNKHHERDLSTTGASTSTAAATQQADQAPGAFAFGFSVATGLNESAAVDHADDLQQQKQQQQEIKGKRGNQDAGGASAAAAAAAVRNPRQKKRHKK